MASPAWSALLATLEAPAPLARLDITSMELPALPALPSAPTARAAAIQASASSAPRDSPEALAPLARQDTPEPPATPASADITLTAEFAAFAQPSVHFACSAALAQFVQFAQLVMEEIPAVLAQAGMLILGALAEPVNPSVLNALPVAAQLLAPLVAQDTLTLSVELAQIVIISLLPHL